MTATSVDDPDANSFDTSIVERTVDSTGAARAEITTDPVDAAANASYLLERGFTFENTSDRTVPFNIVGNVEAALLTRHDGSDGFARASANLFLEFEDLVGTTINYLPLSPYLRTIEDDDPGATVTESLVTSDGAFDGFNFSVATSAIGDGGDTVASFDGGFRYLFQVEMAPGASFDMFTGLRQANAVEVSPEVSPVPLPAGISMLLSALFGLAGWRHITARRPVHAR